MKAKRILTSIVFSLIIMTSMLLVCSCKTNYSKFSIEINGDASITLTTSSNVIEGETYNSKDVYVKFINAPNDNCKHLTPAVSKQNMVTVEYIETKDDLARFKITAIDNISSSDTTTIITFTTLEGKKSCDLIVKINIPLKGISLNTDYSPYVVADNNFYYINTTDLIVFDPKNTSEKDVKYSLDESAYEGVDIQNFIENYGIEITSEGGIKVENYIAGEGTNVKALTSLNLVVTTTGKTTISKSFTIPVYKAIESKDLTFSYAFEDDDKYDPENNVFTYNYTGDESLINNEDIFTLESLLNDGIVLASNISNQKEVMFAVKFNANSGLNSVAECKMDSVILSNALIESETENNTEYVSNFRIYSINPGSDILVVVVKYKNINEYSKVFEIPITVKEYPISLVVNENPSLVYNIFDYYENSVNGQEFKIVLANAGAFDKTYKVYISDEDFNEFEFRYLNETFATAEQLRNYKFENESSIFVKAKKGTTLDEAKLIFYSSVLASNKEEFEELINDLLLEEGEHSQYFEYRKSVSAVINLRPLLGVNTIKFDGLFGNDKERFYLEVNRNTLEVEYLINSTEEVKNYSTLSEVISIEFNQGADLVDIEKKNFLRENESGVFENITQYVLKSKDKTGYVEFYLTAENGVKSATKKIFIYRTDENLDNFELDISSHNIKKTTDNKNYLGVVVGKNTANIKVKNPNNATIYDAEIVAMNGTQTSDAVNVSVNSKDDLTFTLVGVKTLPNNGVNTIKITVKIFAKNEYVNGLVNYDDDMIGQAPYIEITRIFDIYTYYPIEDVNLINDTATVIDGQALDVDSLSKELNILDVSKYVEIVKQGDLSSIKVEYFMPSNLTEGDEINGDYYYIENESDETPGSESTDEINPFKAIAFHLGSKDHNFIDGKYTFSFTIKISDLDAASNYYLTSLKVVVKQAILPSDIEILNENNYVYLENTSDYGQISARVVSNTNDDVTNPSIIYKTTDSIISVGEDGFITVHSSGIAKVTLIAKASQYVENGEYSVTKDIYVVVADGSSFYPYILTSGRNIENNKYYTLKSDYYLNAPLSENIISGGIDGKFAYSEYCDISNNSTYKMIYNGNGSIFKGEEINYSLKNLDIYLSGNALSSSVSGDYGVIAKTNKGNICNVDLIFNGLEISALNDCSIGLMFAKNEGIISNSSVSGNVIISANEKFVFGGLVAENFGTISGSYKYEENVSINYNASLKLHLECENYESYVGGVVGMNEGALDYLAVSSTIITNAKFVGGVVAHTNSDNLISNLYFTGRIISNESYSIVGGVVGLSDKTKIKLAIVELISQSSEGYLANICGNTVGGIVGSIIDGEVTLSYIVGLNLYTNDYADLKGVNVGGVAGKVNNSDLIAVYSIIKINGINAGALASEVINAKISDAYSYSTGVSALLNSMTNCEFNQVYTTTCAKYVQTLDNNLVTTVDCYLANNFTETISNDKFKDGDYFKYSILKNEGLPYIVYTNSKNTTTALLTVLPTNITANFNVKNQYLETNLWSTENEEVLVSNIDDSLVYAVIYYQNGLEYNLNNLINVHLVPQNASINLIEYISSDNNIVTVENGVIKVKGVGNVTLTIRSKTNNDVKVDLYFSILNRAEKFALYSEVDKDFSILKDSSRVFDLDIEGNAGAYIEIVPAEIVGETNNFKVFYNNSSILDNVVYSFDSIRVFTGKEVGIANYTIYPLYRTYIAGSEYNFVDYSYTAINGTIKVLDGAQAIYSDINKVELTENQNITFNVYVKASEDLTKNALKAVISNVNDSSADNNIEVAINFVKFDEVSGENQYRIIVTSKIVNVQENELYNVKFYYNDYEGVYILVQTELKSTKLIDVELNHYSSTSIYYDSYNSIIKKETTPSNDITVGNLGVLNINLYPSYANVTEVTVVSSVVNNNKIMFTQLAYNSSNNLVAVPNLGNVANGIKLYPNQTNLNSDEFDGNLYVSTLLPTNVTQNTTFKVTVTCKFSYGESIVTTIDLNAKALKGILLTNSNDKDYFYLARGGELILDVTKINFDTDEILTKDNFIIETTNDAYSLNELVFNENGQLIISTDIKTESNTQFTITPVFTQIVNGQPVQAKSNSITITVVDFVVNDISCEGFEDGILNNNLGNITVLKAKLNISKYLELDIEDAEYETKKIIAAGIDTKINLLTQQISKSNTTWNLVTTNSSGNSIYNNLKDNTSYTNFNVSINEDGYYIIIGKKISTTNLVIKVNLSYITGLPIVNNASNIEYLTKFVLNVKTYSTSDNPIPVKTASEFLNMEEGEDYILLNDITLDASFSGVSTKISSFDGNNKIINISGFNVENTGVTSLGLFNEVDENTVIKNVTVNLIANSFQTSTAWLYGTYIDAQSLSSLNFGVIAGTNRGVITNCKVINDNYRYVTGNTNLYKTLSIYLFNNETSNVIFGTLVGVNSGYITNSHVGDTATNNFIDVYAVGEMGGFVGINNGKIASSYIVNTTIYNNSKTKITGGFVAENTSDAQIVTSYIEGNVENRPSKSSTITDGGIFAEDYIGGFVNVNSGNIKDCYSNIKVTTNKRSAGFVYDNSTGYIETSYSASQNGNNTSSSFRPFTGNNEENIVLNNNGIKYCYYYNETDVSGGEDEYTEPAVGLTAFQNKESFEGFIADGTQSSIWNFSGQMPTLYDANIVITNERKLITEVDSDNAQLKYEYIYINNNTIRNINNPIIVTNTQEFLKAFTNSLNLYTYSYNGAIYKTNVNYNSILIARDIDLSTIVDNDGTINTSDEVQKLQDIIFAGNLNGNGMEIQNIIISAKNLNSDYSSFGLFKQIGVEYTYNSSKQIYNNKLDEDNCSVVKNVNLEIQSISATLTRSVGALSGEVINSKLYNINVYSNDNVIISGNNLVGGIAGRISGGSYAQGLTSSLSVVATYDNKTINYDYKYQDTKKIYQYAYDIVEDKLNNNVSFAGGLFGVVDIYTTSTRDCGSQLSNGKNNYLNVKIDRTNKESLQNINLQFVNVYGDLTIYADVVGGLFGYVGGGATIFDARFILAENAGQHLIADYAVGGIAGMCNGYLTYSTVAYEKELQREIDKNKTYSSSFLFDSVDNKALLVGGLVGILADGILTNSYAKVNIYSSNAKYVGGAIGLFTNSKVDYVYYNGYIYAQEEDINSVGIITQTAGYAGFIGRIIDFGSNGSLSHIVSLIKNDDTTDFNLASMVGYNTSNKTEINSGESISFGESNVLTTAFGISLQRENLNHFTYDYYLNKHSSTFATYLDKEENAWERKDKDTFPELTYNKNGTLINISDEEGLRNMLAGGNYTLTSDIYLTKPWSPISTFTGTLSSEERPVEEQATKGVYYKIYNLNINTTSDRIGNSVGFIIDASYSTITNVTFVVGSSYSFDQNGQTIGWQVNKDLANGIQIVNSTNPNLYLGTVAGYASDATFDNVTVEYDKSILTNFNCVGGLIGYSANSVIKNCSIKNLILSRENVIADKDTTQYIGGIVGYAQKNTVNTITFDNNSVDGISIKSTQTAGVVYAGGLYGRIDSINITNNKIGNESENSLKEISIQGGNNVYAGILTGKISAQNIENITISNIALNVYRSTNNYVGGAIGDLDLKGNLTNIILHKSNSLNVDTGDYISNDSNYIGGVIGRTQNGKLTNINSAISVMLRTASTGISSVGGLIGSNGSVKNEGATLGAEISNVVVKSILTIRYSSNNINNNLRVGGLIGYAYKGKATDSMFIGSILAHTANIDNFGSIIGSNEKGDYNSVYYIKELSLTPSRKNDYGSQISYAKFIDMLKQKTGENSFSALYTSIENIDEEYNGDGTNLPFNKGSVYNPIIIDPDSTNPNYTNPELLGSEDKYYLVNNDITISNTINELKGIIVGNEKTLTIKKTLATTITDKAILSSLNIVLADADAESKMVINKKDYTKTTAIVAEQNNGAIYNVIVTGNIYSDSNELNDVTKMLAPICLINNSYINVVASKVNVIISYLNDATMLNTCKISGFVAKNNGAILNSISSGNMQVMGESYHISTKNSVFKNISGFVSENNAVIANTVSAIVLPMMDNVNITTYSSYVAGQGTIVYRNNYVDYNANGNYNINDVSTIKIDSQTIDCVQYVNTNQINDEKIDILNNLSNVWKKSDIGTNYGYICPSLFDDVSKLNTKTDDDYYLFNNLGNFNYIISKLNVEENTKDILIEQENSFYADINSIEKKQAFDVYKRLTEQKPINLKQNLILKSGYVIDGLLITNYEKTKKGEVESYKANCSDIALFVSDTKSIEINNLALTNICVDVVLDAAKEMKEMKEMNIGTLVATTNGFIELDGCFVEGEITDEKTTALTFEKNIAINIGGLVGSIKSSSESSENSSSLTDCVSNVAVNIAKADVTTKIDSKKLENTYGYKANIGGLCGYIEKTDVNYCSSFGDINCSTVVELNMYGTVGAYKDINIIETSTLSFVIYKGAYIHYYKDSARTAYYNCGSSFDTNTRVESLNKIKNNQKCQFVEGNNTHNATITSTKLFNLPQYKGIESDVTEINLESNRIYIITSDITFTKIAEEESLSNVTIMCAGNTIKLPHYSLYENVKIINATIDLENIKQSTNIFADIMKNCMLYNVKILNAYVSYNVSSQSYVGMIANETTNCYFGEVTIGAGRLEVNTESSCSAVYVGGLVGKAELTSVYNSINNATITVNAKMANVYVGGFISAAKNSVVNLSTNNGDIFVKQHSDENYYINVAGLVYAETTSTASAPNTYITFSTNNGLIKGVNYSNRTEGNYVTGLGVKTNIFYSVNNGMIVSYYMNSNTNNLSVGLGANSNVYFSYNNGSVSSSNDIYTLTNGTNVYYSYSLGNGFTVGDVTSVAKLSGVNYGSANNTTNYIFNHESMNQTTVDIENGKSWFMGIVYYIYNFETKANDGLNFDFLIGSNDLATDMQNFSNPNNTIILPKIALIESDKVGNILKTNAAETAYEISSAFELWYWGHYICGDTKKDKDVILLDDIDMSGYVWYGSDSEFKKVFDGKYHTISNLYLVYRGNYAGFIHKSSGTIKNIYFENPYLNITGKGVKATSYISIVCAYNTGKIENILIGQTGTQSFINIGVTGSDFAETTTMYIGLIAGYNGGDEASINKVEAINLGNFAISYTIIVLPKENSSDKQNIEVNTGGMVGKNKAGATISSAVFLGLIYADLRNGSSYDFIFNLPFITVSSAAKHYVGDIESRNKGVKLSYSLGKEGLYVYTANAKKSDFYGNRELGEYQANYYNFNYRDKIGALLTGVGVYTGGAALGTAAILVAGGPVGLVVAAVVIAALGASAIVYGGAAAAEEAASFTQKVKCADNSLRVSYISEAPTNLSGFERNSLESVYFDAFTNNVSSKDIYSIMSEFSSLNKNKVPMLTNFLKMSVTMSKPSEENDTYLINNANQLAYVIKNGGTAKLMQNIDMTKKIWDEGMNSYSGATVIPNGFKIIASDSCISSLSPALTGDSLVYKNSTSDANEFGQFDKLIVDPTTYAYEIFERRLIEAYAKGYVKEKIGENYTDVEYYALLAEAETKYIQDKKSGVDYVIKYPEQVEVFSDAFRTYYYNSILHQGVDFAGKTIQLAADIDITDCNIISLDHYDYYLYENSDGIIKDSDRLTEEDEIKKIYQYAPNFITESETKVEIEIEETNIFRGTFDGNGKTITAKASLFYGMDALGVIKNLKIDATKITRIGLRTSNYGFVVQSTNKGTISGVELLVNNDIKITNQQGLYDNILSEDDTEKSVTSTIVTNYGLFVGSNEGTISSVTIQSNETNNVNITIEDKITKTEIQESVTEQDKQELMYTCNFGLIAGANCGIVSDIVLNGLEAKIIHSCDVDETKFNNTPTTYQLLQIGLICGMEVFDNLNSISSDELNKLNTTKNITIIDCSIKADSATQKFVGAISGYGVKSVDNVVCANFNATSNSEEPQGELTKGTLFGVYVPSIYFTSVLLDGDAEMEITATDYEAGRIYQLVYEDSVGIHSEFSENPPTAPSSYNYYEIRKWSKDEENGNYEYEVSECGSNENYDNEEDTQVNSLRVYTKFIPKITNTWVYDANDLGIYGTTYSYVISEEKTDKNDNKYREVKFNGKAIDFIEYYGDNITDYTSNTNSSITVELPTDIISKITYSSSVVTYVSGNGEPTEVFDNLYYGTNPRIIASVMDSDNKEIYRLENLKGSVYSNGSNSIKFTYEYNWNGSNNYTSTATSANNIEIYSGDGYKMYGNITITKSESNTFKISRKIEITSITYTNATILSDIVLPAGFSWKNASTEIVSGNTYTMIYNSMEINVVVNQTISE